LNASEDDRNKFIEELDLAEEDIVIVELPKSKD
jgi:hypothetical protein